MRGLLVVGLVVVLAAIAAMAFGLIDIDQTKEGSLPEVRAEGGALPNFDVKTADVEVGSTNATIDVPTVGTKKENIELPTVDVKKAN